MADDVSKTLTDSLAKELALNPSAMPKTNQLRSSTARDRVSNAISELEALVSDLNTLIKTLSTIKERL